MVVHRRYRVGGALGPSIWRATDRVGGVRRVLKRPAPDQPGALEREHAHALRVRHPRVRGLCAALRDDAGPLLVLEHIDGRPPRDADEIAVELLGVLVHLHDRSLVHGDLKPDNLLVAEGGLRVIDLALATDVGGPVRGGTPGYLAPEYLRGEPASVAGDLYAFGRTLDALGGATGDLAALVERSCASDPADRPASAAAALASLGRLARPEDRAGVLPWCGPDVIAPLDAVFVQSGGRTRALITPRASGRTRIVQELLRRAAARWEPLVEVDLADPAALGRFAACFGDEAGALRDRTLRAGAKLAAAGVGVLVDDADHADEDAREALAALARALCVEGRGALVVVGADHGLAARLEAEGASVDERPPLDRAAAVELLERAGARAHARLAERLVARSGGRAGALAEAARRLARHPERPDAELFAEVDRRLVPTVVPPPAPDAALDHARAAIERGEGRAAVRALRDAFGDAVEDDDERADLLARGLEIGGRLDEALSVLDRRMPSRGTWRARLAARLGRYPQAIEVAGPEPRGRAVAAGAALASGRLDDAVRFVEEGLARGPRDDERARLQLLGSDAALRRGDAPRAIELARAARALADAPDLVAEAESRLGSAHGLGGDPAAARAHHAAALAAAQEAGEVSALPSYLVNVATAQHALGELGEAIVRYEEAARLSERLGREAMRAAALTNLAGLLMSIGARDEARAVLEGARAASERSGARLYRAQVDLIDAERLAPDDRSAARAAAERARDAFEACGASRQALEARLVMAELDDDDAFAAAERDALEAAGLAARGHRLRARGARAAGRLDEAAGHAERAIEAAHEGHERVRAAQLSARIEAARGRPEVAATRRSLARAAANGVADALPPGLRERFVAGLDLAPEPASLARAPDPALGDGGRRLLGLLRRVLLEGDERRVLEAALDEAVALTRAERAFLLRRRDDGEEVLVARNLDRDTIHRGRFSRSVADRVLETGEPVLTEMATADPALRAARSITDLGLRSILCVPVRAPDAVVGALYLDHRFESARFGGDDLELVGALADVIGMSLENARLHREARERARELERSNRSIRRENLEAAIRVERLEQRLAASETSEGEGSRAGIIGRSRAIRRAIGVARRVAPSDLTVLIEGESGTGKELFARFVHEQSLRSDGPFLAVNCGALPETLLESELFGHVRGAFTGAHRDHPGLFRSAEGGTLFLDEIGEMPPTMQARLLRVLQEREVRAVGAERPEPVDVRVVAATNRDLAASVEDGGFREDLYYRLLGVRVALPPLRERMEDVPELAEHALAQIALEPGMREVRLSKGAITALLGHRWPGNVRELQQTLRRAVLVTEGPELDAESLSLGAAGSLDRRTALRRFDRRLVEQALRAADGNKTAAAKALGVSRMTVHRWIKRYGL